MARLFFLFSLLLGVGLAIWIYWDWGRGAARYERIPTIAGSQNFFPDNAEQDKTIRSVFAVVDAAINQAYATASTEFWRGKLLSWLTGGITVVLTFYASLRANGAAPVASAQPAPAAAAPVTTPPPSPAPREHRGAYMLIAALALAGSVSNFGSSSFKAEAQDQVARAEFMTSKLDSLKRQANQKGADFDEIQTQAKRILVEPAEHKGAS